MMNRRVVLSIVLVFANFGISCHAQVQAPDRTSVFSPVPSPDRESLRRSFDEFITLQTAGDWERVYDRLDNKSNMSREKFVEQMRSNSIVRFVPHSVTLIPPQGAWMITGCGVFRNAHAEQRKGVVSSVYARKVKGEWRLTPVAIVLVKDEPNNMRSCAMPD